MRSAFVSATLSLVAATAPAQMVPGTIASDNAEFAFQSYPGSTTAFEGTANFRCAGATSTDHLYQTWWYWRMNADAREYSFHNGTVTQAPPTSVFSGTTAVLTWPNVDFRNVAARLEVRVYSAGTAAAVCVQKMTVTNNTGSPMTLNLFGYTDLDQCGLFNNVATAVRPNLHSVTDFTCSTVANVFAPGATRHEIAAFPAIRAKLLNGVADVLDNSGLPFGPGDYSSAFQWQDVPVAPGASFSAYLVLAEDHPLTGCTRSATATGYGAAKAGTNGLPAWSTGFLPIVGLPVSLEITNGLAGSPPQLYLGTASTSLFFAPFDVTMLVDVTQPYLSFFVAPFDASHRSSTRFTLPNVSAMCNVTLYAQAFYLDPGATRSIAHTGGLRWVIGGVF